MLTLDPVLAEAQDKMERMPLVRIFATQAYDSIPFDGNIYNNIEDTEKYTDLITSEDGHLIGIYDQGRYLTIVSTDVDRIAWTSDAIYYWSGRSTLGVGISEIVIGELGVIFIDGSRLMSSIVSEGNGEFLNGPNVVEDFASPEYIQSVAVRKLQDGTFFCAYIVLNTTLDVYEIRIRRSSDFITWGSATSISVSGLLQDRPMANISILQVSSGDIMLFFDYADIESDDGLQAVYNIYQILSSDNGSTWEASEKLTNYTSYGTSGTNPHAALRTDGTVALAYTDESNVLFAYRGMLLWDNVACGTWDNGNASNIHFDPVRRRCYISQIRQYTGYWAMCGVVVIDVDAWEVVKTYNAHTNPGYSGYFQSGFVEQGTGEAEFTVFSRGGTCVCVDDVKETVTQYNFGDNLAYEYNKNVDATPYVSSFPFNNIVASLIDSETRRYYLLFTNGPSFQLGYFELDVPADPDKGYKFHTVGSATKVCPAIYTTTLILVRERNMMVIEMTSRLACHPSYPGTTILFDLGSGGIIKQYRTNLGYDSYPVAGTRYGTFLDGCIYTSFVYCTIDNQEEHRGLCKINIDTDIITYHQPTYATANDYGLRYKVVTNDGRILIAVNGGVAEFDAANNAWHKYDRYSIPGLEPNESDSKCQSIAYDEEGRNVLVGSVSTITTRAFTGLRMFSEDGAYTIGKLLSAQLDDEWNWGEPEDLTVSKSVDDVAITIDQDNVLWGMWTDDGSTMWDKDIKEMEMVDNLIPGIAVSLKRSVTNTGTLSFSVANGHLFDSNNTLSTWNNFLKKGKLIEVSFGDEVNGIEYWQPQGKFVIESTKLKYERGAYPQLAVTCVCPDYLWSNIKVVATANYETIVPENMTKSIIMEYAKLEADQIYIDTFPNSHEISHQWVDTDLSTLLKELLDHFQCIMSFDIDGNFVTKVIETDRPVDHVYTGLELINYTPDDSYSSFTNRVTIKGEGLYFMEVTYAEELIETITGTCGWWDSGDRKITVNYSTDREKVCYDPRLVVETGIAEYKAIWKTDGTEYMSYIDPLNRYCVVTIELPGQIEYLLGLFAVCLTMAIAIGNSWIVGGPALYALTLVQLAIYWCIAQVCSYEYEVYAKPTGSVKQELSYSVDDLEFLRELAGVVVTEEYSDPFCYTVQSCREVAEYEMSLIKSQRKRVQFEKLAHLQDEVLDKIRIAHPYSGVLMDVLISDLERSYVRPVKGTTEGTFVDKITGWII